MEISIIFYITLALFLALGFAFFQYLYKIEHRTKKDYIFFSLRAVSVCLIILLLVNPKVKSTDYDLDKPELIILADNSQSVSFLGQNKTLSELAGSLERNSDIRKNFNINRLSFGEDLNLEDSLHFNAEQTDIHAALSETEDLFSDERAVIVLLTDGNQSSGRDFRYFKPGSGKEILPVIIGDTAQYKDLSIGRINVNRYAFLNNRFPVEVFVNYSGKSEVESEFIINSGNRTVFRQKVNFSADKRSSILRTELPASSLGVQSYTVEMNPISDEKNLVNNTQNFAIEVIDERTSVLVLSDMAHPDLGALKKSIQSNKLRSVDIKYIQDKDFQYSGYQLIILYQPNRRFNDIISDILENNYNYLIITGTKTDWNYLNNLGLGYSKSFTSQPQEIFPVYNNTFSSFQFENIGFADFPPLTDKFGTITYNRNTFNVMLTQELQGVETGEPLLAVSQSIPKSGFLLGENLWRWRTKSYIDHKSFREFDDFIGKLVQNLASQNRSQRLTVEAENFYYANQSVIISAQYFDENYQFDSGENLKIKVINMDSQDQFISDLVLKNNFYQFDGGDLKPGKYAFEVYASSKNLSRSGNFQVIDYNSEQQFVSSNHTGMQYFAENNSTKLYYPDQVDELAASLLNDERFKPVQKSRQKTLPLIDWYYLLFILITFLAVEWFYRKYLGLI